MASSLFRCAKKCFRLSRDRVLRSTLFLMCVINMALCLTILRGEYVRGALTSSISVRQSRKNMSSSSEETTQQSDISQNNNASEQITTGIPIRNDKLPYTNVQSDPIHSSRSPANELRWPQVRPSSESLRSPEKYHSKSQRHNSVTINHGRAARVDSFSRLMTTKYQRVLQDILLKCKELLRSANVSYFMYSGTLLGSYRHHGIIPWDDDADIAVRFADRHKLFTALSELRPTFFLNIKQGIRWKFFSIHSRPIRSVTWSWPFLDVSFYHENSTHIWDADDRFNKTFIYQKTDVFPLTRRPFMGMLLPAPRNTTKMVLKNYNPDLCSSLRYSHKLEKPVKGALKVRCNLLRGWYPLVKRKPTSNGINETLEFRGKVLSWFYAPSIH